MDTNSPWAEQRVLITGHTGFKGGWLAWWLHDLGAQVHGYSLPASTQPSFSSAARVDEALASARHDDIRDIGALGRVLEDVQPTVIFHLAAQALVPASYLDPLESFSTNVMGTANVLEAARACPGVRAVLVVTSDKCYQESVSPHLESDPLGGHDPYSASKACAELVAQSYRLSFRLPEAGVGIATARAGNVIGGGDWTPGRLVPDLLRAVGEGQPARLRYPHAVRPWQHVLEPLAGYISLAERLLEAPQRYSKAYNFGPENADGWAVSRIAERLLALAAADGIPASDPDLEGPAENQTALHEAPVLRLNSGLAHSELAWRGRLDVPAALQLTWEWHYAFRRGHDMTKITRRQIADYRARLAHNP